MEIILSTYGVWALALATLIALAAGAIKGVVGFAMPTIMISGLASFMSPDLALAGLILPTLVTNGMQALRQGVGAALDSIKNLTAIDTPKQEHLRIQGTIYGLGATALFAAHLQSGVIRGETLPLSVWLVVPAVIGIWLGFKVQDRINQELFRRLTLWVLFLAGLNLIRRGVMG